METCKNVAKNCKPPKLIFGVEPKSVNHCIDVMARLHGEQARNAIIAYWVDRSFFSTSRGSLDGFTWFMQHASDMARRFRTYRSNNLGYF
ncbi:hypothetical protein NC653_021905 [Populus alba x Populus x berolinensis]|uniref:Uncharacterized protein n=1 Tax=Populus alba x Populus x berolinensis TaxID=444605 RepID=A0AAD6MQJ5_9ROSI|nr:hypothetical protein NC653_021905 [Populus alba x Populus x berolinensis]